MILTLDTTRRVARIDNREVPLFSAEAFAAISQIWVETGWSLEHWATFSWHGRQLLQLPQDALRLAEAVWRLQPQVIVETGVYDGGSTLLLKSACPSARIISVDIHPRPGAAEALHGVASLITGDSADPAIAAQVRRLIQPGDRVFVFLDSDHRLHHVAAELDLYSPLVSPGSYIVVADGILPALADLPGGHPSWISDHPAAAVSAFLQRHPDFSLHPPGPLFSRPAADPPALTYFRNGWLRRILNTPPPVG